jgi:hypothetical protein
LVASRESSVRVSALGQDRAGEMRLFRFLHNERVTAGEMVQTARARTLARAEGRHILAIQDTTSLRDASNTSGCSLQLHPTIAVDAVDNSLIGLIDAQLLKRSGGHAPASGRARSIRSRAAVGWMPPSVRPHCSMPGRRA